jgi:multidrug resistance efflux pump
MDRSPALRRRVRTVSSTDAFVLAHLIEIAPTSGGVVARLFVKDRQMVRAGQPLLDIARGPERSILRSSVAGIVSRCRVRVGDAVDPTRPLLSIIRADDVLAVGRFEASAEPWLWRGKAVSVRIPRASAEPISATLIGVSGSRQHDSGVERDDAPVRVVARLESAPPAGLWSGMDAIVDMDCDE